MVLKKRRVEEMRRMKKGKVKKANRKFLNEANWEEKNDRKDTRVHRRIIVRYNTIVGGGPKYVLQLRYRV